MLSTMRSTSARDLKKLLSALIGMHPLDQKLLYKEKERDSATFLDVVGVRDRSKLVLVEDPTAKAKRLLEQRRAEKMEKVAKSISAAFLNVTGVRNQSKLVLVEDPTAKAKRLLKQRRAEKIEKTGKSISAIGHKSGRISHRSG